MKLFGNLAFVAFTALAVTACAKADNNPSAPTVKGMPNSEALDAFTEVAEQSVNSVVSIKSFASVRQRNGYYGQSDDFFSDPFFDFFFGSPQRRTPRRQPKADPDDESQQRQLRSRFWCDNI